MWQIREWVLNAWTAHRTLLRAVASALGLVLIVGAMIAIAGHRPAAQNSRGLTSAQSVSDKCHAAAASLHAQPGASTSLVAHTLQIAAARRACTGDTGVAVVALNLTALISADLAAASQLPATSSGTSAAVIPAPAKSQTALPQPTDRRTPPAANRPCTLAQAAARAAASARGADLAAVDRANAQVARACPALTFPTVAHLEASLLATSS